MIYCRPNHLFQGLVLVLGLIATLIVMAFGGVQNLAPAQSPGALTAMSDQDLRQVAIHLERSTCYGDCPAYKLAIFGDGRVEYEGLKHVKDIGARQGRLEAADVRRLLAEFDKANYFTIEQFTEEHCTCTLCTDMPTTITELKAGGATHRVQHYYACTCAPKPLFSLEQSIDEIARVARWTGDVSKAGPFGTTCFRR